MIKLADFVIQSIRRMGLKHVFVLPGGGCMHLMDSVGRCGDIDYVCCLHEQACAFAVEAYAEFSNGLGVAIVTSGPGGTNTVTGVAAAWIESASCLFLSGQAKRSDLIGSRGVRSMGQQEVDIVSVVRPITKYAVTVLEPDSIRYHIEKAAYLATHGRRGPVWIDLPLDVQASMIDESRLEGFPEADKEAQRSVLTLSGQVAETIDLFNKAERPAVFVGNGVRAAGAQRTLNALLDVLKCPVLTTWKAMDLFPETHELYAGRPGAIGQRGANFTQQNSDWLLVLGARLDLPQIAFNHKNFARYAKKVMVDIDPAEIGKMDTEIHVPVCANVGDFLEEFLRQVNKIQPKDLSHWLARVKDWQRKYPVVLPEYWDTPSGVVNYYVFVDALSDVLSDDELIVPGSSGPCSDIFMQAFRVRSGQRILNAPGLGAMGTGLPGAIGACLASGRKRTVSIIGDGGFQLNLQELETVRRLDLPIKFFVLCNGGYASIMAMQRHHFDGRLVASDPSSRLTFPDICRVAAAYCLPVARISSHDGIREAIGDVLSRPGPVVCAVDVSPDQQTAPRATSMLRPDGVMVSKPMEDMWPFLTRGDFRANMIVPSANDDRDQWEEA